MDELASILSFTHGIDTCYCLQFELIRYSPSAQQPSVSQWTRAEPQRGNSESQVSDSMIAEHNSLVRSRTIPRPRDDCMMDDDF